MKIIKQNTILSIVFFILALFQLTAQAKIETVLGSIPLSNNPNIALKVPETTKPEIILSRSQYVISYNKNNRSPNWVAWKLEANQIGTSGRSNNFMIDNELESFLNQNPANSHAVDSTEYKGSCFDRGHQIPSADRTDDIANNEATFLMSNMIPQTPYLNRVIWEHLEQYTRNVVQQNGKKAYIIAGPIYELDYGKIGPNKDIPVPSKNFKIIYFINADQTAKDINSETPTIAVIMPNVLQDGSSPLNNPQRCLAPLINQSSNRMDWQKYVTTIEEVEKESGVSITRTANNFDSDAQ